MTSWSMAAVRRFRSLATCNRRRGGAAMCARRDESGDRRRPCLGTGLQCCTEFRDRPVARLAVYDHRKRDSIVLQQWLVGREQLAVEAGDAEDMAEDQENPDPWNRSGHVAS